MSRLATPLGFSERRAGLDHIGSVSLDKSCAVELGAPVLNRLVGEHTEDVASRFLGGTDNGNVLAVDQGVAIPALLQVEHEFDFEETETYYDFAQLVRGVYTLVRLIEASYAYWATDDYTHLVKLDYDLIIYCPFHGTRFYMSRDFPNQLTRLRLWGVIPD